MMNTMMWGACWPILCQILLGLIGVGGQCNFPQFQIILHVDVIGTHAFQP